MAEKLDWSQPVPLFSGLAMGIRYLVKSVSSSVPPLMYVPVCLMYATVCNPKILIGLPSTKESTEEIALQFSTLERQGPFMSRHCTNIPTHPPGP